MVNVHACVKVHTFFFQENRGDTPSKLFRDHAQQIPFQTTQRIGRSVIVDTTLLGSFAILGCPKRAPAEPRFLLVLKYPLQLTLRAEPAADTSVCVAGYKFKTDLEYIRLS